MKNLKVATKLIISFGAVIIMTIACSLVSVIGLKSVHGNVNLMIDTEIKSLLRVKDVEIQVETIGRTVRAGARGLFLPRAPAAERSRSTCG